jgi:RHS repeat-associated protein
VASTKTGTSTTYYTRDPSGVMLARKLPTGAHEYFEHLDNLGSVTGLDNSSGGSVATKAYDPYGNLTTNTSSTQAEPFGYAGGYTDPYGSLVHFGLRWYDPGIQRWTQPDQLDMPSDLEQADHYLYGGANPVGLIDPSGEVVDTILKWLGNQLHAGERFLFSNKLARRARIGSALGAAGRLLSGYSIINFANQCANRLTGGGLEGHNNGSCNPKQLLIP